MEDMVELRSVTKRFGDFVAVDNVDLRIRAGEFLTLLGPSGCGKTTLLRMISGFETPTQGEVVLAGNDVTHLPPYRRDVNQVFQSYALFPHLNVWDNIAFGLKMQRISKGEMQQRVQSAVELVSLAGMERRKPQQLSGGQKQRVALARALVCRPKVLLLDEPLSALDAKLRRSMQIELKRLQGQLGITFVFVTHDQEEALVMSDRIALIHRGKIEQMGSVSEIYHSPRTQFVADFIGQANVLEAKVMGTDGKRVRLDLGDFQLEVECASMPTSSKVLICVRPEKISLSHVPLPGSNIFPATVQEELFRGATDQLLLRCANGLELTAVVANESTGQDAFHRNDSVYCSIHCNDVVILQ